jgi:hypothetical protein
LLQKVQLDYEILIEEDQSLDCTRNIVIDLQKTDRFPRRTRGVLDVLHNTAQIQEDGGRGQWDYTSSNRRGMSSLEDLLPRNFIANSSVMFSRGLYGKLPTLFYKVALSD